MSRLGTLPDDIIGSLVDGRYKVTEAMAAGSMGAVYKAERIPVGKLVAIKFLHASFANDSEFQARFERETRVMSKLAHPNCVSVVDFGTWEGAPYLVMDYIAGTTLRSIIDKGPLAPTRALAIARQIAAGLAHAHAQGVVHRDVKPANIMISEEIGTGEHVRILDFGLARLRGAVGRDATQSNVVVGTPNYMAPEQTVGGGIIDARTDVYAVGVVLFEMIAGERPFQAEDTLALLGMHRAAPIPKLHDRVGDKVDVPDGLQGIVDKAMAKSPDDRYQSAIELADAIAEIALLASAPRAPEVPSGRPSGKHGAQPRRSGRTDVAMAPTMVGVDVEDAPIPRAKKSSSKAGAVLAVLVLGGGVAAGWYVKNRSSGDDTTKTGSAVVAQKPGSAQPEGSDVATPGSAEEPITPSGSGSDAIPTTVGSGSGSGSDATPAVGSGSDAGSGSGSGSDVGSGSGPGSAATAGSGSSGSGSDAGSGAGSGSAKDIEMDPGSATAPEVPGAGSGAKANDEATDAPAHADEVEKKAPPTPALATTVDGAIKLIKEGKRDIALASLRQMAKTSPKSSYIPFVLGNLYFDQLWWGVAMDYYERAIRLNGGYRANGVLIKNVIRMLASSKTSQNASNFLRGNIGKPAVPYLQQAARYDDNATVKRLAGILARQIR